MTAGHAIEFGPRLVVTATGRLRAAVLVKPGATLERALPLPGEPGAICARALEQHAVLRATLEYCGVETTVLESSRDDAYETAAADAAVVFAGGAAVMRPTSMTRRTQADRMQMEFARLDVPLAGSIESPGLLDGNDVILAGDVAFVGVGSRGNDLGRSGFAALASAHGYRTVEVKLAPGTGALRSVASAIAPDTIVVGPDRCDLAAFDGFRTIVLERGEERAAGLLCLDARHVVAEMRYRTALMQLRREGIRVEALDLYEFTKIGVTPAMLVMALQRE